MSRRVADRIGHRIAEQRNIALGHFADHRGGRGTGAGAAATTQIDRRIQFEDVFSDPWRQQHRDGGRKESPQKQSNPGLLDSGDKGRARRDPHDGDEYVQADVVHEPEHGRRNTAEGGINTAQPTDEDPGDQRTAGCRQRDRDTFDRHDDSAKQTAEYDAETDKDHVCRVSRPVCVSQILGDFVGVRARAADPQDVAAIYLGLSQHRECSWMLRRG